MLINYDSFQQLVNGNKSCKGPNSAFATQQKISSNKRHVDFTDCSNSFCLEKTQNILAMIDYTINMYITFSALRQLIGQQKVHTVCENRQLRYRCGYMPPHHLMLR